MPVAALCLALAWCWVETSAAAGDGSDANQASPRTVFSTGRNGSQLKWVSRRPAPERPATSEVTPTQYLEADASCEPAGGVRAVQNQQPVGAQKPMQPAPAPSGLGGFAPPVANGNGTATTKPQTLLNRALSTKRYDFNAACPSPKDLKPISDLSTDITPSDGELPKDCPLGNDVYQPRCFSPITYTWTASGLCHKPLYFEDVQLERYGHMAGPWVQPFASGAHFFLTIPILPYKMGLEPPNECLYTLGYYRTGSCAPYLFDPLPLSIRGALFEAGGWVAACFMF